MGSGKTMLCRVLMERLPRQVQTILLSNPSLSRDEIIYAIAEELDLGLQNERLSLVLLRLQEHLVTLYGENQRVVLLIDEAHAMPQETLEQVRLLSNLESSHSKLLQIVLFGQPELDAHLSMPHMRQLKERITHSFRLEPLLRSDIEAYLDFRMRAAGYRGPNVFAPGAVRRIVKASEGLTRRVNILADKSLLAAFADNEHGITARHVNRAIRDSEFYHSSFNKAKIGLAAAGVAGGLALGLGLHYLLAASIPAPVAPPAQIAPIGAAPAPAATPAAPAAAADPPLAATTPAQPALPAAAAAGAPLPPAQGNAQALGATPATPAAVPPVPTAVPERTAAPAAQQTNASPIATKMDPAPVAAAEPVPIALNPAPKAPPVASATVAAPVKSNPEPPAGANPGSKNYAPPAPSTGKLTRERFTATQEWLKAAPGEQYSIQLLTTGKHDLRRIEDVLARAAARNLQLSDFYVYGVKINDQQHYRLAYGLYPDLVEVNQGIKNLPPIYRQFGMFYRSVERMRSQNRQ